MKITSYLLIALMSMGIEGCPSDQLASNEACSGQAPTFRLNVVSDTMAPFSIAIDSVGTAVHKTTKQRTQFNPITGVGQKFNTRIEHKYSKGFIYDSTFRPTDIHKNKGCIKEYTVSASVKGKWTENKKWSGENQYNTLPAGVTSESVSRTRDVKPLLNSAPKVTDIQLVCKAPSGQQIKICTFNIRVGEDFKNVNYIVRRSASCTNGCFYTTCLDGSLVSTNSCGGQEQPVTQIFSLIRPEVRPADGSSRAYSFANE
jgi:hypothetical protein